MKRKLKVVAMIPARMGSTRFPGKPLEKILGLPMIEHVRRRVEEMDILDEVYVATCDQEIMDLVVKNGGKSIMTASTHERCTDRIEEAARSVEADIIVNVQGDEPMVYSSVIKELIAPFFENDKIQATCLVYPIINPAELESLNIVKTVLSKTNKVLYFSRALVPGKDVSNHLTYYKQSGIMAYNKEFLHHFNNLEQTPLEIQESVDMLRILENDYQIHAVVTDKETKGVDTPEQIKMLEDEILGDPLQKEIFDRINKI